MTENVHDYYRYKEIERTSLGLSLMAVGLLTSWIPYIKYLGDLLEFIGAIFIILGRNAFGNKHSSFVIAALLIFITSFILTVASAIGEVSILLSSGRNASALTQDFKGLFVLVIVATGLVGVSMVMLAYRLSNSIGRIVLYSGFITLMAIYVTLYFVVVPIFSSAITHAFAINSTSPIIGAEGQLSHYYLLASIPYAIFAVAYFMARGRIASGEIPKPESSYLD